MSAGAGTAWIVEWDPAKANGNGEEVPPRHTVDFDPQSLQLVYAVSGASGALKPTTTGDSKMKNPDQQTGDSTALTMTLLFDTSTTSESVQNKTEFLVALTKGKPNGTNADGTTALIRRALRFQWGQFIFTGCIQSMTQTIDFFSKEGVPLRATVTLGVQGVARPDAAAGNSAPNPSSAFGAGAGIGAGASFGASVGVGASVSVGASVGTMPLTLSQSGDSVQAISARAGAAVSWKAVAAANSIDNPRLIPPGTVLNLNVGASAQASAR